MVLSRCAWHLTQLFGGADLSTTVMDFSSCLDGLLRLSAADAKFCEKSITTTEIQEAICKTPDFDGLRYEFCVFMPDLFGDLLANVYRNWQQNGRLPSAVNWDVMILLKKDTDSGDILVNFWSITLLNTESKI